MAYRIYIIHCEGYYCSFQKYFASVVVDMLGYRTKCVAFMENFLGLTELLVKIIIIQRYYLLTSRKSKHLCRELLF